MELQIEIDARGQNILDGIRDRTGLAGYKEVFNSSLTLLDWAIRQEAAGKIIAAVDERKQEYTEVDILAFESTRKRRKNRV